MVEIHIDTKRDSDEEIRKAIRYLQSVIGDSSSYSTPSSSGDFDAGDAAPAFTNIFGSDDDAPSDVPPKETDDEATIEIVEY